MCRPTATVGVKETQQLHIYPSLPVLLILTQLRFKLHYDVASGFQSSVKQSRSVKGTHEEHDLDIGKCRQLPTRTPPHVEAFS